MTIQLTGRTIDQEELLTPGEVAKLFKVDPKTVTRWAHSGRLSSVTTPGGHKRFRKSEVCKFLGVEEGTGKAPKEVEPRHEVKEPISAPEGIESLSQE